MNARTDSYWLGHLSMSVVWALAHDKPKPFLQRQLRQFMADRPPGDPLKTELQKTLSERKR